MLRWRQRAEQLKREALVCYFVFKHPRTRWYGRLVAASTVAYLFSPIQLIPSFIPVIGFLDDFVVLVAGVKLLQRIIPSDVLTECRERAEAVETGRREKIKSPAGVVGFVVVASLWVLAAVTASALMVKYVLR